MAVSTTSIRTGIANVQVAVISNGAMGQWQFYYAQERRWPDAVFGKGVVR